MRNAQFDCSIFSLQALDARIVYASFHRIVVATRKTNLVEALSYVEYVSNSLRARDLYHSIDLQYVESWTYLLWKDPVNFGGVCGRLPSEETSQEEEEEVRFASSGSFSTDSQVIRRCSFCRPRLNWTCTGTWLTFSLNTAAFARSSPACSRASFSRWRGR